MGMLDLFREWQRTRSGKFRARRRTGSMRVEELEIRRVLSPMLTGSTLEVDGTAAANVIAVTQDVTGVTVTIDGTTTSYGPGTPIDTINVLAGDGDDQITINGIFNSTVLTVDGGTGTNTLISPAQANLWAVTGPNSGTLNGNAFSNIQNLVGGGFTDTFQFGSAGFVSGYVDGGSGINILDYSTRATGAIVNLQTSKATAVGGVFMNITDFHGSGDNSDLLIGANAANTWDITSGDTGDINSLFFFAGVENLTGGTSTDSFVFSPTGFVQGTITGGAGANTLDYSSRSNGIVVTLQANASTAIGTGFNQIGLIIGSSSGSDLLTAINDTNNWNITGANAGTVNSVLTSISFQGIENLVGGTVSDRFKFGQGAFVSGTLSGGGGNNTLDYSGRSDAIQLNLQTSTATGIGGGYVAIQNLVGSSSTADKLIGTNVATNWNITAGNTGNVNGSFFFSSVENLQGGKQNDSFVFFPSGFISGQADGDLGTNTIDYSQRKIATVVNLQNNSATAIGGGFINVTNLIGITKPAPGFTIDPDTLIGANGPNTWNITGADTGNVNGTFTFKEIENVTGGSGVDTFKVTQGGSISGTVNGGAIPAGAAAGGDWLDYSTITSAVTANLGTGVADDFGKVVNVQNIHGGSGIDTLTGSSIGNILVGGSNNDTLTAGSGRSLIIGGVGTDKVSGGAAQDIVIGGFTDFDNNFAALSSILAEWQSSNSLDVRVNHLRNGGGLNKTNVLVADQTVHNDAANNAIYGGAGPNWLWGSPAEFKDKTAQDITNTPINNPPVLAGASNAVYNIGGPGVIVNPNITISDIDSLTMTSATVRLTQNFAGNQDNLGFVGSGATGNIVGSYNATTGTLTLSSAGSTATVAQWQAALQSVTYSDASPTPSTATRSVVYQIFDGIAYSNPVTSTVSLNYAPTLSGSSSITYTGGQAPTTINPSIVVNDVDNVSLASATIRVASNYVAGDDFLTFTGDNTTGNITGVFNFTTGTLTLTSAGNLATLAQFQAALRLVKYENFNATPLVFPHTIAFNVFDGSATSNTVNSTVTILPPSP